MSEWGRKKKKAGDVGARVTGSIVPPGTRIDGVIIEKLRGRKHSSRSCKGGKIISFV